MRNVGLINHTHQHTHAGMGVAREGGTRGPAPPPPIDMLPMIKMSQKRLLFLQFLLTSSRTTIINNNIDPGGPGRLNLILVNQLKWVPYNNV